MKNYGYLLVEYDQNDRVGIVIRFSYNKQDLLDMIDTAYKEEREINPNSEKKYKVILLSSYNKSFDKATLAILGNAK